MDGRRLTSGHVGIFGRELQRRQEQHDTVLKSKDDELLWLRDALAAKHNEVSLISLMTSIACFDFIPSALPIPCASPEQNSPMQDECKECVTSNPDSFLALPVVTGTG